jgi:hypothetical protein
MPYFLIRVTLILLLLTLTPLAIAEELGSERFVISLGAFVADRDTSTRVDSNTLGRGTTIVLEDDLGLDSSQTVFRIDGHMRIAERHRLDFSVYDLSRDSTLTIDQDIQFGDEVFSVDTSIDSNFDLNIYKIAYTYSVWSTKDGFLGVGAGIHVADLVETLSVPSTGQIQLKALTAPLPVIGIRGAHYFTPKLRLIGAAEYFALEYNDIDGRLVDVYLGMDYKVMNNLALGVAYNYVSVDVNSAKSELSGGLDWQYDGFLLYFKFGFGSLGKTTAN